MKRKPYKKPQPANWYMENTFFKVYMLRELTSVPVALAALNLFWGIAALARPTIDAWHSWLALQTSPLFIIFNIIAIIAALFNSVKWFEAMPKAIRIQKGEKFVPDNLMIMGNWVTFAGISVVMLIVFILLA
ncbi:fumarate reductase subunit C [Cardiobacteriaceae bacterium TAE3-ERU3]|nr:fumarate reductase subunit C [Cardiobacteriaceae bacterium TAE3-ERU3]